MASQAGLDGLTGEIEGSILTSTPTSTKKRNVFHAFRTCKTHTRLHSAQVEHREKKAIIAYCVHTKMESEAKFVRICSGCLTWSEI